ncbi:hypothetical protein CSC94_18535 [Zhengella mangrovi]|uniref:Uncharacterized protein n=1 Tax=Zhengella mangrovi TaxID=1982044 RepID=A0A2G1QJG1_9HYPH|nr:hypothetical protein [Zhengella mangrovi]PHP65591.1 hypothetical protein CSC94_18535 [Zhengella mangrovi]
MSKFAFLAVVAAVAIPAIHSGTDTRSGGHAAAAIQAPTLAMGSMKPAEKSVRRSSERKGGAMKRYIVTHNCPDRSAEDIARSMEGTSYSIVKKMQYTPQFVIEASDRAVAALRKNRCIKSIQRDGLNAPAGG